MYLSIYFQVSFADLWNSAFNLPIMAVRFLSRYSLNNLLCSITVKSMNTPFYVYINVEHLGTMSTALC